MEISGFTPHDSAARGMMPRDNYDAPQGTAESPDRVLLNASRSSCGTEEKVIDGVKTYITGNAGDVQTETSPGLCLMGGSTEVDGALKWMIDKSGGGDFVVLRADDSDGYNDYIYRELGGVDSVQTLVIDSREKANSPYVEEVIKNAEALFIAGGDQWQYFSNWDGTKVEEALSYLANEKKVPLGGTSAGCHAMAGIFYSAENDGVSSSEALNDPYDRKVTLRNDFLAMPRMRYIVTDSHFHRRNRMGRSAAFLARSIEDGQTASAPLAPRVIALDEKAAVTIDADGTGRVWATGSQSHSGSAYFLEASARPQQCVPGLPLTFNKDVITCYRIKGTEEGESGFTLHDDGTWGDFRGENKYPVNIKDGRLEKDPY
jgi:cyanophycinase